MERIRNFTFDESFNRDELLEEALEVVRYSDIKLSDESAKSILIPKI